MTPADHARTVREALPQPGKSRWQAAYDALDALQTQAETAEERNRELNAHVLEIAAEFKPFKERAEDAEAEAAHQRILRQDAEAERERLIVVNDELSLRSLGLEAERDHARDALRVAYHAVDELCSRPGTCLLLRDRAALGDKP